MCMCVERERGEGGKEEEGKERREERGEREGRQRKGGGRTVMEGVCKMVYS